MKAELSIYSQATINSIEILELVERRHDSVKRTIERLVKGDVIQLSPMVIYENIDGLGLNQKTSVYRFEGDQGKRDSIIVVAQRCPDFREAKLRGMQWYHSKIGRFQAVGWE
ncbi:Rha family transcriptional regulator [Yersinia enterocolitica]|uniref:hypothetical protein n=1 Tax=Yersinia enterocolitica TaxID=630 RepID=UPI001C8D1890|nr:hypothetical protein [Yersinia enterocolitica]MBX9476793.1 hypothetical protein [Yersinia enterocolitica]